MVYTKALKLYELYVLAVVRVLSKWYCLIFISSHACSMVTMTAICTTTIAYSSKVLVAPHAKNIIAAEVDRGILEP